MKASLNNFLTLLFAVMMSSAVMAQSAEECFNKGSEYHRKDNYTEAFRWYRKAADLGHVRAYMMVGICYEYGYGVSKDETEAVKYYRKAADLGLASGQEKMGVCYETGTGVKRNMTEAVKWYRKAALKGYSEAQYNLGWCYENGKGVAKNMAEANKWYKKAEAKGCKSGGMQVTLHRATLDFGKILTKAVDAGDNYKKGEEYYKNKNYTEAIKCFRKAAESDHASAQFYLGLCYEKGYGVTQNYTEAVKWYRKAAENKNASAQCNLGFFYEKGYGVTKNLTEAVNWYRKAAENGSSVAQCNLGNCYESGIGVTKDYAEAVKWYRKAAEKENTRAIDALKRIAEYDRVNGTSYSLVKKKVVMERRYMVNKANNYCYPATSFRMDNNLQLEIRYFNTDHYQGSYSNSRHGIYIAVGRCEDVNFDWNVKDCDNFDAWYVCAVTINQWVNEKIEFDENGNVHYYMNGKDMGTHQFEMLKKLANSKTLTFDINPYGWYTGQHHYMDVLKLTLPTSTISDNFNDGVLDSNYLTEFIRDGKHSLFKTVGATERPDVAAARLLEGRIAVIVDGTPMVLTVPYLFGENFQSDEDYYVNFFVGSIGRFIRYLCFFLSTSIPAIFIALTTYHIGLLPTPFMLSLAELRSGVPFSSVTECLVLIIVFEILREAGTRTPQGLGSALSIVGGLVVGQAAVEAKIISAPMLIAVALAGVAELMIPRLKGAILYLRISFTLAASLMGLVGYMMLASAALVSVLGRSSMGVDYTVTLRNISLSGLKDTLIRAPWTFMKTRPMITKDIIRQRKKYD